MSATTGTPSIVYRPLRRSDRASYVETVRYGVGNLERSTGLDASAEDLLQSMFGLPIWAFTHLAGALGRPVVNVEVALDGTQVVGTGTILWVPNVAYVAGLATRPEYRGRGIASRILSTLASEARSRHRAWLALDVESENETALQLYHKAGYRQVAEFSWLTCTGAPSVPGPIVAETRPMMRSDSGEVTEQLDAGRPEPYRSVFPARPRLLNHNEFLVRSPSSRSRTWVQRNPDGSFAVLRAYFSRRRRLGALFLDAGGPPRPTAEELSALVSAAAQWLKTLEPARCLAVAREPAEPVRTAYERAGFVRVVASKTMVREIPR